ncbi:hypothetical protein DMC14_000185 [Metamycoplasma phocicerebrale]|uniref:Uncharacterized protein n=1 Tax=Metamycoplasma phocicerebrale TaxID=142649 RepID=A0A3Q9VBE3_9BACT|nr:hypothetical protein [Metamycoplasma phocicerebrale]AZZ65233.2 hypothetical protein DMC14_000185 [Metamycoplasma phocicerebrale]
MSNKLEKFNNQFFELAKKERKYKHFEEKIASVIIEIEDMTQVFENNIMEFENEYKKQGKSLLSFDKYLFLRSIFKKAKKEKSKIKKIFNKTNKWASIESSNITNIINFVLKINNSFKEINEFYKENLNSYFSKFLSSKKKKYERKIINIINWFQNDKYLNKPKKEIKRNRQLLVLWIKEYTILVVKGIKYFNFISLEIEDKIFYAMNVYNDNKEKIKFLYSNYWIKNFCSNIKIKIKEIKNTLALGKINNWDEKIEKELININYEIEEVIINLSKEVFAYRQINENKNEILNILDLMSKMDKKLQNYKINDSYKNEYSNFMKEDLKTLSILEKNNMFEKEKISYAIKLGELIFSLKKMLNIVYIQENILTKKKWKLFDELKKIQKENTTIYNNHDFDYPLSSDIQTTQSNFNKEIKRIKKDKILNKKELENLNLYNQILNWKIIILNSEIIVSKQMLENYPTIIPSNNFEEDNYLILNNLFYSHKYKEVIVKIIEQKNNKE